MLILDGANIECLKSIHVTRDAGEYGTPMLKKTPLLLGLSLALLASGAQASEGYEGIEFTKVQQDGSSVAWGKAVGVVDHPIQDVLAIVQDYQNYSRFLPNTTKSRVLSQRGSRAMVYMEVGVMKGTVTLWGQMRMSKKDDGETLVIEVDMVQGNMDQFRARWELTPVDEKSTRVDFRILVDPNMPLPASVFTGENVKAAKKTVRALRRRANQVKGELGSMRSDSPRARRS